MNKSDKNFAVISINDKQILVEEGDRVKVDSVGSEARIEVLMYQGEDLYLGEPALKDFGVKLEVLKEVKDKKVVTRRYKPKSRYRRNRFHRQPVSIVEVKKLGRGVKTALLVKKETKDGS